jgi:hypothetical protein
MALSVEVLDRMARITARTEGGLVIATMFTTRGFASATPRDYGPIVAALWEHYSDHVIAMQALVPPDQVRIMREDRRVRVSTSLIVWTPTLFDEAVQPGIPEEAVIAGPLGGPSPYITLSGMPVYAAHTEDAFPYVTSKGSPVYFHTPGDLTSLYVHAIAGTRWRVMSISGGDLMASYLFQVRRLPPR